ncbi:MAG: glycosyltransferase family 4 protein [Phycisphaerales bacterium]|nr:MAG: glycosyltransferase family 4 protein [Phycisphaerales bacterium]
MKLAYLASRYPSVSHTFIMREIQGLRGLGFEIETFTIRRPSADQLLTDVDCVESDGTYAVLPVSMVKLLWCHLATFLVHPGRYLSSLWHALQCRPPGLRAAVWHLFYFAEAGVLAARLRRRGIEHVHVHFANVACDVVMLASQMNGGRWSMTLHGLSDFGKPGLNRLKEKIESAASVVCVSDFGRAQAMLHSAPEVWSRIHRVRCGIDTNRYLPPTEPREGKPESIRLLCVARLGPEKGLTLLLEALKVVVDKGVGVCCTLVGDGPQRELLQQSARDWGLAEHVNFAGAVGQQDIHAHYDTADIFVLPSLAEGLPVVLMEAMAKEVPVIATRIMGIPELVDNGVNGLLVPPGCVQPLARAISELAGDADKRRQMGAKGREKVCREFDLDHNVKDLAGLFSALSTGQRVN